MNITTMPCTIAAHKLFSTVRFLGSVFLTLIPLSACVIDQTANLSTLVSTPQSKSNGALAFPATQTSEPSIGTTFIPVPTLPKDPKEFALDLIGLVGATPNECGAAADNSPHVNWTCAQYNRGVEEFMATWDRFANSSAVTNRHSFLSTSNWMYFEVDGEIDFFWKTYSFESTQALIAYDSSETGNEIIIGLNPTIGDQFELANGSGVFTEETLSLPIQN